MFCWVKTVVIAVTKDPLLQEMLGEQVPDVLGRYVSKVAQQPGVPVVGFGK